MFGRTPIAWRNVTHRKVRSFVALSGVSFSVLLVFMQLGFYFAVLASSTAVYRALDADIFLTSPLYVYLGRTGTIPRERLYQAEGIPGVRDVAPFYADIEVWRNPETRLRHQMLVMGIDPERHLLTLPANTKALLKDDQVLIDSLTRSHFGPLDVGVTSEIADRRVWIAGQYRIGPGFATDGAVIMSDDSFVRIFRRRGIEDISVGMIRLSSGVDSNAIAAQLRRVLPADTRVFTRGEMIAREQDYWGNQTSIGPVFASGAVLGLIIGIVIVYQVMVTDIANRLPEYATLKALGYDSRHLRWIVFQEVSAFAAAGFVFGLMFSAGLYKVVRTETSLPMSMDLPLIAAVAIATLAMCWTAGLLATRKLRLADPADLC
jgi:putative ABC transport system permease protein